MKTTPALYEIIYVSTLAPDAPIRVVGEIAATSRVRNQQRGITGLLIFDGMRFCQQLEGAQRDVVRLLDKIRQDHRHVDMEVVHDGFLDARRFQQFNLGYAAVDDEDTLASLERLDGEAALQAFLAMLSTVDF